MTPSTDTVYLFTGEPSGDSLGAQLIHQLKVRNPGMKFTGVGGPKMEATGFSSLFCMDQFSVMGFSEVLKRLPRFFRLFSQVRKSILRANPAVVVFIDYPEFNIRMAQSLRKHGFQGKLVQYICPTVWAWGKGRIPKMESALDQVLCIFPFEVEFLKNTKLNTLYIGQPTLEAVSKYEHQAQALSTPGLPDTGRVLALFPGSRRSEIQLCLDTVLTAATRFMKANPDTTLAISLANPHVAPLIEEQLERHALKSGKDIFFVPGELRYELMQRAHAAIATSGTVCLEIALHKTPTVVVYDLAGLNRFIAKYIAKLDLPYYCNVNIICGREIFPERIALNFNPETVYTSLKDLWVEGAARQHCLQGCEETRKRLALDGASDRAAQAIENLLPAQMVQA